MWFEPTSTFLSQTFFWQIFKVFANDLNFTKVIAKVDYEALGLEIRWTIEQ